MDNTQKVQESQYAFPYHYIPTIDENNNFSQFVSWSWGARYIGGMKAVLAQLRDVEFSSLIDIGCGDGRFLREVSNIYSLPERSLLGVDYSDRAIALAKAMNPGLEYDCVNIIDSPVERTFDVATMVEVLEHIPPPEVEEFLNSVAKNLRKDGLLVLTVPHKNKRLQDKHYQHFTSQTLKKILENRFDIMKIVPFDYTPRIINLLTRLLGYTGKNYIITNQRINNYFYNKVLQGCLTEQSESRCGRLLAVARVK